MKLKEPRVFYSSVLARVEALPDPAGAALQIEGACFHTSESLRELAEWLVDLADYLDKPETVPVSECIAGKHYRTTEGLYSGHVGLTLVCVEKNPSGGGLFIPVGDLRDQGGWTHHGERCYYYSPLRRMVPVE